MSTRTQGRCPDCGASVDVSIVGGQPGEISPHSCPSRRCEYPRCRKKGLVEDMVGFPDGEWTCPEHGLLLATKGLVSLYRAEDDADWTAISEIIAEIPPGIVAKVEARASQSPGQHPQGCVPSGRNRSR